MSSVALPQLYSSLSDFIRQTLADRCETRVVNLLWIMYGIFLSRSVQLNHIARKMPSRAKKLSTVKRFSRFLDNTAVRPRLWYDPFARWMLYSASNSGKVHLIMDSTRIAFGFRLVMVSIAYRRRSLPLLWMWERGTRGHSTGRSQIALLQATKDWLSSPVMVSVVGDCEFGRCSLIEYLCQEKWDYALRQIGSQAVWWQGNGRWQRVDSLLDKPGCRWLGWGRLTHSNEQLTHLVAYWRKGETQAWWLATNQSSVRAALALYRRRMWIEAMFADLKKHGFDLQSSHLRSFQRLGRLTLAVCLLYIWLVTIARLLERNALGHLVDRHDRRDLSLFRLGWDFIERCLALSDPIPIISPLLLSLVSGS